MGSPEMTAELTIAIVKNVGSFARPDYILIAPQLPKTRSGKIMRRLLRKIACLETDNLGDLTTLADPGVVDELIVQVKQLFESRMRK